MKKIANTPTEVWQQWAATGAVELDINGVPFFHASAKYERLIRAFVSTISDSNPLFANTAANINDSGNKLTFTQAMRGSRSMESKFLA
jgi:hypothetical protein